MKMENNSTNNAGIDISKAWADVAIAETGEAGRFANTPTGHGELAAWLEQNRASRIGLEASGGYERGVVAHLRKQQFTVTVFQPMQVKAYGRFLNRRAKTDALDAQMIARCMAATPETRDPPDPRLAAMGQAMTYLEQIGHDIARLKTRLESFTDPLIRDQISAQIRAEKLRQAGAQKALLADVAAEAEIEARYRLILSVPGIGEITALNLLIRMPELGRLSREEAASLAGVAPFDRQTGKSDGQRHIAGGRGRLRKAVYAAALPAAFKHNPALIALYQRLIKAGKSHKAALIACVRKLIIFVNTVVARGTPWAEKAPKKTASLASAV